MAIYGGEIIRITDHQRFIEQEVLNTYYYQAGTDLAGATASTVAEAWWDAVGSAIVPLQATALVHERIVVESLDGSQDVGEFAIPIGEGTGGTGGVPLSPYDTYSFTLRPENRQVRPGGKRIAGVTEENVSTGGYLVGAITVYMNAAAAAMAATFNTGIALDVFIPVIVGFPILPSRPARIAVNVANVTWKTYKSTQNTRKIGHGS